MFFFQSIRLEQAMLYLFDRFSTVFLSKNVRKQMKVSKLLDHPAVAQLCSGFGSEPAALRLLFFHFRSAEFTELFVR